MKLLQVAMILAVASIAAPVARAEAQCTARCECTPDGCGCSLNGGNGDTCNASGDGCFVSRCNTAVVLGEEIHGTDADLMAQQRRFAASEARRSPDAAVWEMVAPGQYVRRSCEDTAEFMRRERSAGVRNEVQLTI